MTREEIIEVLSMLGWALISVIGAWIFIVGLKALAT